MTRASKRVREFPRAFQIRRHGNAIGICTRRAFIIATPPGQYVGCSGARKLRLWHLSTFADFNSRLLLISRNSHSPSAPPTFATVRRTHTCCGNTVFLSLSTFRLAFRSSPLRARESRSTESRSTFKTLSCYTFRRALLIDPVFGCACVRTRIRDRIRQRNEQILIFNQHAIQISAAS